MWRQTDVRMCSVRHMSVSERKRKSKGYNYRKHCDKLTHAEEVVQNILDLCWLCLLHKSSNCIIVCRLDCPGNTVDKKKTINKQLLLVRKAFHPNMSRLTVFWCKIHEQNLPPTSASATMREFTTLTNITLDLSAIISDRAQFYSSAISLSANVYFYHRNSHNRTQYS